MKELSIEEKAKAYDKALERAEKALEVFGTDKCEGARQIFSLFPELKESEDERIRKEIIATIHLYYGEPLEDEAKEMIAWLEKQGKQKPTDEVEPKFKVGDYIKHNKANIICKIISVNSGSYYVENIETSGRIELFNAEQNFHLWTIQDAKDGDVLVDEDINIIGIFEGIEGMYWHSRLYYSSVTKELYGIECGGSHQKEFAKPATKEQRDTLIKAMTDAGYTFDFEKKELKKTEQSPKWKGNKDLEAAILGAHPTFKQNPAWSEEDERNLQGIIDEINANKNNAPDYDLATYDRFLSWIKSLKERIGGKAWEY